MNNRVTKIVVTGGPCAGKSSVMAVLQRALTEAGIFAVVVPEAAREFRKAGLTSESIKPLFQSELLRYIFEREDRYARAASYSSAERIVLLCDRGAMDCRAYMGRGEFHSLLDDMGLSPQDLSEHRYDAAIFLRTAADGVESCYETDGERVETPEVARRIDEATLSSWHDHPHLVIIPAMEDFGAKKLRAIQGVFHLLGIPVPTEIERKYRVRRPDPERLPASRSTILIVQTYLVGNEEGAEFRVRQWTHHGASTYFKTVKRSKGPGVLERVEEESIIDREEYDQLLKHADPRRRSINKVRTCFVFNNLRFELDDLTSIEPDLYLMEVELTDKAQQVDLPPFIDVIEDVTENPAYKNSALALKK